MDLGSGITFDIFTHGKPRVIFFGILFYNNSKHIVHIDDLEDGYNVARI